MKLLKVGLSPLTTKDIKSSSSVGLPIVASWFAQDLVYCKYLEQVFDP